MSRKPHVQRTTDEKWEIVLEGLHLQGFLRILTVLTLLAVFRRFTILTVVRRARALLP